MKIVTINPATGQTLREYESMEKADVDAAVRQARSASETWRAMKPDERGQILRTTAAVLRRKNQELAETMTKEMGKVIRETKGK